MSVVTANHDADMRFTVTTKKAHITIDAKEDSFFSPADALLAALTSCMGVYLRKYAKNTDVQLDRFSITASSDYTDTPPFHLKDITIDITLHNETIDKKRKSSLLRFVKNCPIHNTLTNQSNITINLHN